MKKKNKKYSVLKSTSYFVVVFLFWVNSSFAQCGFSGWTDSGQVVTPTSVSQTTSNVQSGNYFLMDVVRGGEYQLSTCTLASFDTQLSVYGNVSEVLMGYNDDDCGLQSTVVFVANFTGQVRVVLTTFNCQVGTGLTEVSYIETVTPTDWCTFGATVGVPTVNDFDGDGVNNECDEDDDNDGILDTVECVSGTVNENVSGGNGGSTTNFSVGNVVAATFNFERVDNSVEILVNGNSLNTNNVLQLEFAVSSGEVFLELASDGATMSQPWIANDNGLPRLQVIIDENGFVSFNGTRNTVSTSLESLRARDGSSFNVMSFLGGNNDFTVINPNQGGADGIEGTVILTTCSNTDGDANLDFRDTDSDDDGCADAFEGASTAITGGLSTLTGGSPTANSSSQNLGTTSDAEGNPLVNGVEFIQATAPAVTNSAISVACTVDVSLQKSVNNALPKVGQNINYTITVTNSGPLDATGVVISDALPAELTYVSDTPTVGTSYNNATGEWDVDVINVGEVKTLVITATVNQVGVIVNTAQVSQLDQTDIDSATP